MRITAALLTLFLAGCGTTRITKDISISHPRFMVVTGMVWKHEGALTWNEDVGYVSSVVPNKPNQRYMWSLDVHTKKKDARYFHIDQYPSPNSNWQKELKAFPESEYSADRTRITYGPTIPLFISPPPASDVSHIEVPCYLPEGSPAGDYSVIVFVDTVPVHIFRFSVPEKEESNNTVERTRLTPRRSP